MLQIWFEKVRARFLIGLELGSNMEHAENCKQGKAIRPYSIE